LLAAGIWLSASAGCQQLPSNANQRANATVDNERTPPLAGRQVADVQLALGRSLERQGDFEQAMAAYAEAVKQDRGCGSAYLRLAILHDRQGQFKESEDLYRKALAANPGDTEIYCDRGYSLYLQHCWTEAEMNLRQALALRPDHKRAHNNLGLVLANTGRSDESLVEFRRAGCSETDAQTNLAYVLTLERHWAEARKHYELALAQDVSSDHARKGLGELNALMNKANGASKDSGSTISQASLTFPASSGVDPSTFRDAKRSAPRLDPDLAGK
jgi:Flp pilus assembly protein TadD